MAGARARLAADIGGTFTDIALEVDGTGGGAPLLHTAKVLTTQDAPADAVLDGVERVLREAGIAPAEVGVFIHGTTLATNALIERRGARTALLTTQGIRDSVEMAHENRFEQYDLYMRRPEPLVPRNHRIGIPERLAADGTVLLPLDENAVRAAAASLAADGVTSVAVGYLHSYLDARHEERTAEILAECWPEATVTMSSEVCPEIREYERFSTACANAYIAPLVRQYLTDLDARLTALGLGCELFLMTSGGGLGTLAEALRFPVRLIESGPAGGALLASGIARGLGCERALSFDMGGTTAKLCIVESGHPRTSREFEVGREYRFLAGSGLPLRLPVIEMVEIGAGGGSIASLDALGRITVGPASAGSEPGPAAYGRGGIEPTVTDADAVLGRLAPERFAGGTLTFDVDAAAKAVGTALAEPSGLQTTISAIGISEVVDENMANAGRVHAADQGCDISSGTLIAFGGAAPLHAARVAAKLGIDDIVVPAGAGVGSAIGFLAAPVAHESVRTRHARVSELTAADLAGLLREMAAESNTIVDAAAPGAETATHVRALMRYRGQGHEITVDVDAAALLADRIDSLSDAEVRNQLRTAFTKAYQQLYTRHIGNLEIEVLSWLLEVRTPQAPAISLHPTVASEPVASDETALVTDTATGRAIPHAVFERGSLTEGAWLAGPALITEDQTTTLVPDGAVATVTAGGHLRLTGVTAPQHPHASAGTELRDDTGRQGAQAAADAAANLDAVRLGVQWNRLISVTEEQARALVRAAFSTSTREAGDLSAGIFDPQGRMLAQSVTGTPGHVNSMAYSVLHFLDRYPASEMRPGDIFLTNDPWKGTGHLFDIVVVTPAFLRGELVALFACTSHVVDIGGAGFTTDSKEVYHEGLYLPILKFATDGVFDPNVVAIIEANVRDPVQVIGDIHSLAACNETGAARLISMMDEYAMVNLDELAEHIITSSHRAMLEAIGELPEGTWNSTMRVDGMEQPIDIVCSLTVGDDGIDVDFAGTGPQSSWGINVPMAYTDAYTSFGVRCIIGPDIPNNTGSLDAVQVRAPEGCILNAPHPAAVNVRHVMGQLLPDAVFGCLSQVVPERVPAEGTSSLWNLLGTGMWEPDTGVGATNRSRTTVGQSGDESDRRKLERYILMSFHSGGAGARPQADGLSATAFPSGVRNMPVEVNEIGSPLVFWRKEFRSDSGGQGKYRGGLGQVIELENRQGRDFSISATYERTVYPARGRHGGGPGALGRLSLDDGTEVRAKGRSVIFGDRRLIVEFPGGGGYGDPAERDPEAVTRDRQLEFTSPAQTPAQ
ncbi:hydantoinase B/oxoprolinase family protein [Candidatus Poriferisodalis sp.]|uniref:hydantoinase B/oxoprolinase family protein n=1 Tax=Candidatus Poriferisodalis sp. TaxID=3101277 RepID=UPI003B5BA20B